MEEAVGTISLVSGSAATLASNVEVVKLAHDLPSPPDVGAHDVEMVVERPNGNLEPLAHHRDSRIEQGDWLVRIMTHAFARLVVILRSGVDEARAASNFSKPLMGIRQRQTAEDETVCFEYRRPECNYRQAILAEPPAILVRPEMVLVVWIPQGIQWTLVNYHRPHDWLNASS